jgi:hypothetical protein
MMRVALTTALAALVAAVVGAIAGGQFAGAAPTAAAPQDVRVVNTTSEAVPVKTQGLTRVTGLVQVLPAGEPVQSDARIFYPPDTEPIYSQPIYEVPDGKRLVVEHVTGALILGPQTRMQVRINGHFLPFQLAPHAELATIQRATASEPIHFVVDDRGPNAGELRIEFLREGSSLSSTVNHHITFSGFLIDL